jgi:carboxynorspermidine decarboxylase
MKVNVQTYKEVHFPIYVLEERRLRRNLELIRSVAESADVEIILAFKAYSLWKTFPIFREYIHSTTASSLNEARMAFEKFGAPCHAYSPAYTDDTIGEIARCSSHLTFNSLSQFFRHKDKALKSNPAVSIGLRINPEYSEVSTDLYNPCSPGTRFGVTCDKLPETLYPEIDGFHCHCLCESGADVFARTLVQVEKKFSRWFPQLKWINFGGGHLMTRKDYDVPLLISTLKEFHLRYPHLKVILEPGSAFGWGTGQLVSQVVDIVEDSGIRTAILNVSFTCHMPDCLEMPYYPQVRGSKHIDEKDGQTVAHAPFVYRLGGNSCLSGDFMGLWQFEHELQIGENVIFEDMLHYTTVKTCMFNGVSHPAIGLVHGNNELEMLREFSYEDYLERMD